MEDKTFYLLDEMGKTGLNYQSGFVYEEYLKELAGLKGVKVYKEMSSNDPTVSAVLFAIEMLCRQVTWEVKPYSDDNEDLRRAEFLKSCMNDMSHTWVDFITEVLSMLTYGWDWHELVYKIRAGESLDPTRRSTRVDGMIGWRKLAIRSQDSLYDWIFDDNGGVRAMRQNPPPDYRLRTIPIEKSILFRAGVYKNNPEGKSALRGAYRPWYFKKNIENIEAIGIERDLAGLPTAYVPPEILSATATPQQKALLVQLKKIITGIRRDEQEGVIWPLAYDDKGNKTYDLQLLSTGGRRQFETTDIITRYDQRILMTMLADFILLGHEKVGSFALASSKTELFSMAIGAWLTSIADTLNRFAVPRLFQLNGDFSNKLPKIEHGDVESVDLTELSNFITSLASAGAQLFPDPKLESHLKRQAGLPVNVEEQ